MKSFLYHWKMAEICCHFHIMNHKTTNWSSAASFDVSFGTYLCVTNVTSKHEFTLLWNISSLPDFHIIKFMSVMMRHCIWSLAASLTYHLALICVWQMSHLSTNLLYCEIHQVCQIFTSWRSWVLWCFIVYDLLLPVLTSHLALTCVWQMSHLSTSLLYCELYLVCQIFTS